MQGQEHCLKLFLITHPMVLMYQGKVQCDGLTDQEIIKSSQLTLLRSLGEGGFRGVKVEGSLESLLK